MLRLALLVPLLALAGCKEAAPKPKPTPPTKTDVTDPPAGSGNTNYQAGGGAVQNVRNAAKRVDVLNDMRSLGTYITALETQNNKMPTKAEILAEIRTDAKLSKLINDGTIILTGTAKRSALWAYETEADTKGGVGLVGGTPNRYDASQIKTYLQGI